MAQVTLTEALTGEYIQYGALCVPVAAKSAVTPNTLEYAMDGYPVWGVANETNTIKKVKTVSWSAIKKIGGVLKASIKKLLHITPALFLIFFACGSYRPRPLPPALAFGAGVAYGIHETVVHHPDRIPESWDRQWWDATKSWTNKYKGGSPANGEKFFGSTTFLAWTTDAKHLFGTAHRITLAGSAFTIGLGEKRPFLHYVADFGLSFVAYSIGFHATYSVAFKK